MTSNYQQGRNDVKTLNNNVSDKAKQTFKELKTEKKVLGIRQKNMLNLDRLLQTKVYGRRPEK